jgi:hypothetical protein
VANSCVVNSWNEWDPLEEVIVGKSTVQLPLIPGTCEGAASMQMEPVLNNLMGASYAALAARGFSDCSCDKLWI